jgi:phosphoglycerate dehydrogenase-like enzyme
MINPLDVTICSNDAESLNALIKQSDLIRIKQCETEPSKIAPDKVEVLFADPDKAVQFIGQCQQIIWMQSTWAGNSPLVSHPKRDYMLSVAKGVFDVQIREYVFAYLLAHTRRVVDLYQLKHNKRWQPFLPSYLSGKTLGVLGTGSLAQALIPVAKVFGMQLIGVSRSGSQVEGFDRVYRFTDMVSLAQDADFVVNLLPDTPETQQCLNTDFFNAMKVDSLLINAGRGSVLDEAALLDALKHNRPSTAVLDVFGQEPLPSSHPFWHHQQIQITHHTAAITRVEDIAALFLSNVERVAQNLPPKHVLDWQRGY